MKFTNAVVESQIQKYNTHWLSHGKGLHQCHDPGKPLDFRARMFSNPGKITTLTTRMSGLKSLKFKHLSQSTSSKHIASSIRSSMASSNAKSLMLKSPRLMFDKIWSLVCQRHGNSTHSNTFKQFPQGIFGFHQLLGLRWIHLMSFVELPRCCWKSPRRTVHHESGRQSWPQRRCCDGQILEIWDVKMCLWCLTVSIRRLEVKWNWFVRICSKHRPLASP